jgi:hypothetical protein
MKDSRSLGSVCPSTTTGFTERLKKVLSTFLFNMKDLKKMLFDYPITEVFSSASSARGSCPKLKSRECQTIKFSSKLIRI